MKEIHAGALARLACCVLVLITFGSMTLHAQFSSGIEGTVTDPSGAAVRNATITLQSLEHRSVSNRHLIRRGLLSIQRPRGSSFELHRYSFGF